MDQRIDEQVRQLLSKHSGHPAASITREQSLQGDLGIDGDDAVELFTDSQERFELDLSPLHSRWSRHFGPEGVPLSVGLLWVSVIAGPMLLGVWIGWPQWAAFMTGFAVWVAWIGLLRGWPLNSDMELLTVAHLIEAAATKRWPVTYIDGPT
jgi:acyl carrier protein